MTEARDFTRVERLYSLMKSNYMPWAAVGAVLVLFSAIDLLGLLLVPESARGIALLLPALVSAVVTLLCLKPLIGFLEKQDERLRRQEREIDTLHAMDTAIASQMDSGRVLDVAVREATRAVDGEQGGVLLLDEQGGSDTKAGYAVPEEKWETFRAFLREGTFDSDALETVRMPLIQGETILGYLGVARQRPCSRFTPNDQALLKALSGMVVVAITNARALEAAQESARTALELKAVTEALIRERHVAQMLQEGLLPEVPQRSGTFYFSKRYEAQASEAQVGGDIYDLFRLGEGLWGVVIADVSGKGLAAAQKTAMVKYALRSYAREHRSPAEVVTRLNDTLFDEPNMTGFVTLVYGRLCEEDGRFIYASAGHEPPIVHRADGSFETLSPTGLVLGAVRDMDYTESEIQLNPGDGLLLYTDGLTEARSAPGEFLEIDGLTRIVAGRRACPPSEFANSLMSAVRAYAQGKLSDDAAILWIERAASTDREPGCR